MRLVYLLVLCVFSVNVWAVACIKLEPEHTASSNLEQQYEVDKHLSNKYYSATTYVFQNDSNQIFFIDGISSLNHCQYYSGDNETASRVFCGPTKKDGYFVQAILYKKAYSMNRRFFTSTMSNGKRLSCEPEKVSAFINMYK